MDYFLWFGVFILLLFVTLIFSDLLILLIRYRKDTDNWEYPIDLERFREFCEKIKKENE